MDIKNQLQILIYQSWVKIFGENEEILKIDDINLEHPSIVEHGDYATNLAMTMFVKIKNQKLKTKNTGKLKLLETAKNPLELARVLAEEIKKDSKNADLLNKVDVAPPGFINFWLSNITLSRVAYRLLIGDLFPDLTAKSDKNNTIIIDYSSPNIAKPFGIGHLRSTNIGQAIYNLYQFLGWKTIGDNHLGDWGTQFGKLIYQIKSKILDSIRQPADKTNSKFKIQSSKLENLKIEDLEKLYVEFHQEAEKKPELEEEARRWFKKLEEGDPEAKRIWQFCVNLSLKEFDRIYQLLGVKIDCAFGESFYHFNGWLDKVIKDVQSKGLLEESQGAKVMVLPQEKVPAMLVKSDGATTYFLRDLATIKFRKEKWDPDLIVYEVGGEQKLYFRQVFKAAEILGYLPKSKLIHTAHGLIRWKHGKFSTRKGDTIHLEKVLDEAIERARKIVDSNATGKNLSEKEKEKIAKAVGIGAIKFNDLKQEIEKDIVFDWEKILLLDGYSSPYLQYTYARAKSVLAKSQITNYKLQTSLKFKIQNFKKDNNLQFVICNEEMLLLRTFYKFEEAIVEAAEQFSPHIICLYLFDLAQKFNLFYQKCRILGNPKPQTLNSKQIQNSNDQMSKQLDGQAIEQFRLFLTAVTANILKIGLKLLGIETLEKM